MSLNLLYRRTDLLFADNPQSVQDFRSGKDRALGFLVGQTMKAMKGKADHSPSAGARSPP